MGNWELGWYLGMCRAPDAGSRPAGSSSKECLPSERPHSDMAWLQATTHATSDTPAFQIFPKTFCRLIIVQGPSSVP